MNTDALTLKVKVDYVDLISRALTVLASANRVTNAVDAWKAVAMKAVACR
jgi:hypothetical protein